MQNAKEKAAKNDLLKILKSRRYQDDPNIKPDKIYFTVKGEIIGTAGNFVTLAGLPKAGKTRFISAAIASAIAKGPIWDMQLQLHENKNRIGLFDTEQSPYDFNRLIKSVKKLSNSKHINHVLDSFLVREDGAQGILQLINAYLESTPSCGILIIDGLLDLLDNMNDEGKSKRIIRIFKKWTKQYDCLIITVLHLGKSGTNTLGHIGSMSDRYAQSTLEVAKDKTAGGFSLSPKFCRSSIGFDPISIMYNYELNDFIKISL